jgi:hypothetical protein
MVYDFSIFPQGTQKLLSPLVIKSSSSSRLVAMAPWNEPMSWAAMKTKQTQYSPIHRRLGNDEWRIWLCGLGLGPFSCFQLYFVQGMCSKKSSLSYVPCNIFWVLETFYKYTLAGMWPIPKPNSGLTANKSWPMLFYTDAQCLHIAYLIILSSTHKCIASSTQTVVSKATENSNNESTHVNFHFYMPKWNHFLQP